MDTTSVRSDADSLGLSAVKSSEEPAAIGRPAVSFGLSFAVAVLVTALFFAVKAAFPVLEEWAEEVFGHAWLYQGVLAVILFVVLGLVPMKARLGGGGIAAIVFGSTVVSGLIILAAAALMAME